MAPKYKLKWSGLKVLKAIQTAENAGLKKSAQYILGESRKVVPLDEAALSRSGTTSTNTSTRQAAISYDTPYAVKQHEDLTLRHAPGRTGKYLETPLNAAGQQVLALCGAALRRRLQ